MIETTTALKKRVVAFISGGGSNMLALAKACQAPDYPAEIIAVISDKPTAGGLEKAKALGIDTFVFERKSYSSKAEHEAAILKQLAALNSDIICLAGYMRLISGEFIKPYEGRILNIHPSILPLFPGLNTHERALEAGVKLAGCTVHFVTEGMDEGPIIGQAAVPILSKDTSDTLAARVLTVEHQLYPNALKAFAEGKVKMTGDKSIWAHASNEEDQCIISL